jgi:hypothetical protein
VDVYESCAKNIYGGKAAFDFAYYAELHWKTDENQMPVGDLVKLAVEKAKLGGELRFRKLEYSILNIEQ